MKGAVPWLMYIWNRGGILCLKILLGKVSLLLSKQNSARSLCWTRILNGQFREFWSSSWLPIICQTFIPGKALFSVLKTFVIFASIVEGTLIWQNLQVLLFKMLALVFLTLLSWYLMDTHLVPTSIMINNIKKSSILRLEYPCTSAFPKWQASHSMPEKTHHTPKQDIQKYTIYNFYGGWSKDSHSYFSIKN